MGNLEKNLEQLLLNYPNLVKLVLGGGSSKSLVNLGK